MGDLAEQLAWKSPMKAGMVAVLATQREHSRRRSLHSVMVNEAVVLHLQDSTMTAGIL